MTSRAKVKVVERRQDLFLTAVIDGLGVTMRHFFRNLFEGEHIVTQRYPEEKTEYPPRVRGHHYLTRRDDGEVRCVACMCCPTACPAHCITIVAEDTEDGKEKRPAIFEIDELRCVVCGLCVEACPCDAIRMDSGKHTPPVERRGSAVLEKADLLKVVERRSTAVQGGCGPTTRPPPRRGGRSR
jgi:NADH-quinone oxidoreductase subunit I